ncbi:hypothetical protein VTN00DRAFT_1705 [Thermoascus crustaceus]|uniref:uncharacterized protein n=1 Tax=Thermoascus crustaceus TaxID=5088 RepID=UPI003742F55C
MGMISPLENQAPRKAPPAPTKLGNEREGIPEGGQGWLLVGKFRPGAMVCQTHNPAPRSSLQIGDES